MDKDYVRKNCVILYLSLGSIERWMYAILEEALKEEIPVLPLWLAPSQVRVIRVFHKYLDYCKNLNLDGIRFDIDDSSNSLGKKIMRAQK